MNRIVLTTALSFLLPVGKVLAENTDAAAGAAELNLLNMIFIGPLGFSLGLIVAVAGIITFFYQGDRHGIMLIVLGTLITLTPGVYNAATHLFIPMARALWGF